MWFFTKKINKLVNEAVSREFEQIKFEVDSVPDELRLKLSNLNLDVSNVGIMVNKLRSKTFKAQGIEKIVLHKDYYEKDVESLKSIAQHELNLKTYYISRLSFPVEVSKEKKERFKVNDNCVVALLGIKFMAGDGWGRYQILRGTEIMAYFAKSKLTEEDGIIVGRLYFRSDDILSVEQISGDGKLQVELLGLKLRASSAWPIMIPYF